MVQRAVCILRNHRSPAQNLPEYSAHKMPDSIFVPDGYNSGLYDAAVS